MERTPKSRLLALAMLALVASTQHAMAGSLDTADVDARFRAKIVKEKARQASIKQREDREIGAPGRNSDAECGSQNIGVINTRGRPGAMPREIFVFAPNAINVVSTRGCGG